MIVLETLVSDSGRKKNFPYAVREYTDADYLRKLSDDEREWYYQFEDEYYNNQHREGTLHNASEAYDKEQKRELDLQNNAARRDIFSNSTRVSVRSNDLSSVIHPSYGGHISESLKRKGVERTVVELINDAAIEIIEMGGKPDIKELKQELSKLCMDVTKAIQLEKKYRKNRRRKT